MLYIVDNPSKFPIVNKMEDLLADSLILACNFLEHGLPRKIMSDAGLNFVSDKIEKFCKNLNIEDATFSSHHHQRHGQTEVSIKL